GALESGGQGLERGPGPLVERVRLELDPHAAEPFEGVLQQEVLRLGIRARSPCSPRVPRVSDLETAMLRAQAHVARTPDRLAAHAQDDREGRFASLLRSGE